MIKDQVAQQFNSALAAEPAALYNALNSLRDWFNSTVANYEIFLEDNWFDQKTTIEYTLRCLDTLNVMVFAEDEYLNQRDDKGVWHLGAYQKTRWTLESPWEPIQAFFAENTTLRPKVPEGASP